ncbi:hypothetical protein CHO01_22090 [Cellulomonas hominis]|uniref:Uncharacterized protein n=1 Tax=Cellulomonas hominis TaxID=156981 RepID=A0A511FD01_9CELL|nr:hypothetical protein CHO01_22090 [Cellulomonas hominis]
MPAGSRAGGRFAPAPRGEASTTLSHPARRGDLAAGAPDLGWGRRLAESLADQVDRASGAAAAQLRARTYARMDAPASSPDGLQYRADERACSTALGEDRMLVAASVGSWASARSIVDRDLDIPAQVAARALLARHAIGAVDGWDQEAYDRMSAPWREVIGPLHPDDPPPGR